MTKSQTNIVFFASLLSLPASLNENLHVSTFDLDAKVKICAEALNDTKLTGQLPVVVGPEPDCSGSQVSQKMLGGLYNRKHVASSCPTSAESDSPVIHGLVLAELVSYIQDIRANRPTSVTPVFKMADLVKQYSARLTQYGYSCDTPLNSTRLRVIGFCFISLISRRPDRMAGISIRRSMTM